MNKDVEPLIIVLCGQGRNRVASNTWDNHFLGIKESESITDIKRDTPGTKRIWSLNCQ